MIPIRPDRGPVRRESIIASVMMARPDVERVLYEEFGLPCYCCEVMFTETIEEGARNYGLDPDVVVARLDACPLWPEEVVAEVYPEVVDPSDDGP